MIFNKYAKKIYAILKMITDTLYENLSTFFYISLILRRMRNFSDKSFSENKNTYFTFNKHFLNIVPFME